MRSGLLNAVSQRFIAFVLYDLRLFEIHLKSLNRRKMRFFDDLAILSEFQITANHTKQVL